MDDEQTPTAPVAVLAVEEARAAVTGLLTAPLWALSDAQVRDVTKSSFRVLQSAQATFLRAVAELDERPGAVAGARAGQTAKTFLVHRLHRRIGQAAADVTAARAVRTQPDSGDEGPVAGHDFAAGGPDPLDHPRRLPRFGAALAAGDVSREHLDVAVRALRRIPTRLLTEPLPTEGDDRQMTGRDVVEERLLEWSQQFRPDQTQRLAVRLLAVLDPDGSDRHDPDSHTRRHLTAVADSTGMVGVHGWISAVPGAMLIALLDHYSAPFPARTETAEDGTVVTITDTRSAGQRRADAFTRIIYDAAAGVLPLTPIGASNCVTEDPGSDEPNPAGDDSHPAGDEPGAASARYGSPKSEALVPAPKTRGGEPPRIVITATLAQIREAFALARAGTHPDAGSDPGTASGSESGTEAWDAWRGIGSRGLGSAGMSGSAGLSGSAECDQLGPIPPWLLARLSCDAVLERVLLAENGAVLSLGRAVRTATGAQRRALAARDGGCAGPGCLIPAKWCDVHHVTAWAESGLTDVDQMVLLCPREHDLVHQGILEVRIVDGVPWVRPPSWLDPLRRWCRNTYWSEARHDADSTGRQLRLALDRPPRDRPPQDRPQKPPRPAPSPGPA